MIREFGRATAVGTLSTDACPPRLFNDIE